MNEEEQTNDEGGEQEREKDEKDDEDYEDIGKDADNDDEKYETGEHNNSRTHLECFSESPRMSPGSLLEASWGVLGVSWRSMGGSWGVLGASSWGPPPGGLLG